MPGAIADYLERLEHELRLKRAPRRRLLAERQIVPMINFPDVDDEAIAVYREWLAKPDRVQY